MWRSSKLIGLNVYNDQNEKLGDISEILLDKSGKVEGVVIGVGGFLGMGQHDIKVDMAKLKFVDEPVRTSATTTTTTTTGAANRPATTTTTTTTQRERSEVVSGPCDPERRHQGSAQEHAAVQVQLIGVKSKEKAPVCRGFFFCELIAAQISMKSVPGCRSGTDVARRGGLVRAALVHRHGIHRCLRQLRSAPVSFPEPPRSREVARRAGGDRRQGRR